MKLIRELEKKAKLLRLEGSNSMALLLQNAADRIGDSEAEFEKHFESSRDANAEMNELKHKLEVAESLNEDLSLYKSEHERLKGELNVILHPNGEQPLAPSMCDLVSFVREDLNKNRSDMEEDLIETQRDLSRVEIKLEEIELFFTDEDACPIIEPFNSKGLDSWLKSNNLKQQDAGFKLGFWRGFEVAKMNSDSDIQSHYQWQVELRNQSKEVS